MSDLPVSRTIGTSPQHRDIFLALCRSLNIATALSLIFCSAAFGMAIILRGQAPIKDTYFVSGQLLRVYGIVWSLSLVLVESEWRLVMKAMPLLEMWFPRGVTYAFISILAYREAYPREDVSDFQKSLQLYRTVSSAALLVCAFVYSMGGLLCVGAIRRAKLRQEEMIHEAETEFEEIERRRRELQRLLGRPMEP